MGSWLPTVVPQHPHRADLAFRQALGKNLTILEMNLHGKCYLFHSKDQHVPQTCLKVLPKQSLVSHRASCLLLQSGETTPCPVATRRDSREVRKIPERSVKVTSSIFSFIKFYLEPYFCPAPVSMQISGCQKHTIHPGCVHCAALLLQNLPLGFPAFPSGASNSVAMTLL